MVTKLMKNILYKLGLIADYVVEQGTSGIWTYRKWNSGIIEAWGNQTISTAMTNTIGDPRTYWGNASMSTESLGLLSVTSIEVSGQGAGSYFGTKVDSYSTTWLNLSSRASSSNTTTVKYFVTIKGTWK